MRLYDSHAHYNDQKFEGLEGGASALLSLLHEEGVDFVLNAATSIPSCKEVLSLAESFDFCYCALGIHPEDCAREESPEKAVARLEELLLHEKAVAVGEIGLDYYWEDYPSKEIQMAYFKAQLELAKRLSLPVVIHDRDAHGDVFDTLKGYPDLVVVLHSYSGSPEMARQYLQNPNRYISFSGVLTFKNAVQTVETAKIVPLSRILSETDCPYLAPVPFRGKLNHSGYMAKTVEKLAELKGLSPDAMADVLAENARRVFLNGKEP